MIIVTC